MFLKEWMLIGQTIHMNVGFVITGTFLKNIFKKCLSVTVIIIYYTKL